MGGNLSSSSFPGCDLLNDVFLQNQWWPKWGQHPELLLVLKPASQCHNHDCVKHAPLITLPKVLGFFRKTESKCAICATLLLEMWWKRQWKGKKNPLNVVITVLLGLLSPPCFLLPTAQTTSRCWQQCRGIAWLPGCTGKWQKCRIFPFEGCFQSKWGDSRCAETRNLPHPESLEDSCFLHTSSTINNGLTSGKSSKKTVPVANPSSNKA